MLDNVLFSGGAQGADSLFGECAKKAGHKVVHFAFIGMKLPPEIPSNCSVEDYYYLTSGKLKIADEYLRLANKKLERSFPTKGEYVNSLLRRNYYQIKNSRSVYAVAPLNVERNLVEGGTGWAVQMAIDKQVPEVYVFNLRDSKWWYYGYVESKFHPMVDQPIKPSGFYTGIGSRPQTLTEDGKEAIRRLYHES